MSLINIKNLATFELKEQLLELGFKSFRFQQIFQWLYQKDIGDFDSMTNIKKEVRNSLKQKYQIKRLKIATIQKSVDGTHKFLVELEDGEKVETVMIPDKKRNTLCVSSQVGCAMGCKFCLTATMGIKRNLSIFEIIEQVRLVREYFKDELKITNLVFMGMGEPLHNTKNLYPALEILLDPFGFNFSRQHITVSTSGLAPQIIEFGNHTPVKLAISLNATTDEVRDQIMPVNRKYPLKVLLDACRKTFLPKRNAITFEYVMLHQLNDTLADAKRLVQLLSGVRAKINLLPFNEFEGSDFKRPPDEWVRTFQKYLLDRHFVAVVRRSRGRDILGACGQLATKQAA